MFITNVRESLYNVRQFGAFFKVGGKKLRTSGVRIPNQQAIGMSQIVRDGRRSSHASGLQ
jgi:hypothetical protein